MGLSMPRPPGVVTDALLGEHGVFYSLFDHLERELPGIDSLEQLTSLAGLIAAPLVRHADLENKALFKAMDTFIGGQGPLEVMRSEHNEIEGTLRPPDPLFAR